MQKTSLNTAGYPCCSTGLPRPGSIRGVLVGSRSLVETKVIDDNLISRTGGVADREGLLSREARTGAARSLASGYVRLTTVIFFLHTKK